MTNPITIICEDPIIHTDLTPYCDDPTCPCTNGLPDYEQRDVEFPTDDAPWLDADF